MRSTLLACLLAFSLTVPRAWTQHGAFGLVADGAIEAWEPAPAWTSDSLAVAAEAAFRWLGDQGYVLARLDSSVADSAGVVWFFATRGPVLPLRAIHIEGATRFPEADLLARMDTRTGGVLSGPTLRADLNRLLDAYEAAGWGLAEIHVDGFDVIHEAGAPVGLVLWLRVVEGATLRFKDVAMGPGVRTRPAYVARLLGLSPGRPLTYLSGAEVQARLERSTLFDRIGPVEWMLHPDGAATLRLDVEEAAPGAFDVVVGLQPPASGGGRSSVVGSGHLLLRNLFGLGHRYEVSLQRLPGRVSSALAQATVPYVLGLPLSLEAQFQGNQQDSTLGSQRYRGTVAYGGAGRELLATVAREQIRPGVEGARLRAGQQRVARSTATFAGIGLRLTDLDVPYNPRRGYHVETLLERGRRHRVRTVEAEGVTQRERTAVRQERLTFVARYFRPLLRRFVLALGADAYALRSDQYEEGELFRIGGTTTLRGYDEDRFRARYAARGLAEGRLQLDRRSYAFVFTDVGYIDQPQAPGVSSLRGFYPGYGFGVQVSTGVGLIVATYAASPEDGFTAGRVHLGLSLGL